MENTKEYTSVPSILKKLLIRAFLLLSGFPVFFYIVLTYLRVEFALSILLVIVFIFLILIVIKKYFQKVINVLVKSNLYNKKQIAELKEQYELKEQAYQELESLNFVIDNAALFASAKLDGTVVYLSKKFCDLLGLDRKEIRGSIERLLSTQEGQQQNINDLMRATRQKIWIGEVELTSRKQEKLWLELTIIPMNQTHGKQSLFLLGNNITERKQTQGQMDKIKEREYEHRVQLQKDQASQIVEAQEEERKRIAKDIHDGIGQMLTALKFSVESIDVKNQENAEKKFADLKIVFGQLIKDVRAVTFSLTPPELSDHGIAPALKKMTEEISKLSGKNILFENKTDFDERFDSLTETNLYRVAQEAINNALKYAESTYVLVSVAHTKELLSVMIDDNGKGFDVNVIQDSEKGLGMGLFFMKERINYIDGRLFVNSVVGQGTRITINISL
ncbi:PAS domain-containing sensor histidine kinase [Flavicella sediminum]|uniref:PAS domain-containing sensor histidine kinase n=1 Tax=Flavicella sediminum TaxID=2585141 RepID=UPI0011246ED8|nr:ATP-binding protein [Flavicella sediminum]